MFKYKVVLNGEEVDSLVGLSYSDKMEEPLDECAFHLPMTTQGYEYKMSGFLDLYIKDENNDEIHKEYIVISDEVTLLSSYEEIYSHDLYLIEYSHKFDLYMVDSFAMTKPMDTKRTAKFDFIRDINYGYLSSATNGYKKNIGMVAFTPIINTIKEIYYTNETIVINGLEQTLIPNTTPIYHADNPSFTFQYVNTYIKFDGVKQTIDSNKTCSIDLSNVSVGDHTIILGFTSPIRIMIQRQDGTYNTIIVGDNDYIRYHIRVFEYSKFSVYDALINLRNNISKYGGVESYRYHSSTRLFNIDNEYVDFFKQIELPQMYFQKCTLRQAINTIFSYVNGISRVIANKNGLDILTMDDFNKVIGEFDFKDIASFTTSQDSENYSTKSISFVERALPNSMDTYSVRQVGEYDERLGVPTIDFDKKRFSFQTMRSSKVQLIDDSMVLPLSYKIYQPIDFDFLIEEAKVIRTSGNVVKHSIKGFALNLMDRFVNKEEWDTKLATTDYYGATILNPFDTRIGLRENKVTNLYWQSGDEQIKLTDPYGEIKASQLVFNTIWESINEYFTLNHPSADIFTHSATGQEMVYKIFEIQITMEYALDANALSRMLFNISYIANNDIIIQNDRVDVSASDLFSEIKMNQQEKIINSLSISRRIKGDNQRQGMPNYIVSKLEEYINEFMEVGYRNNNKDTITTVQRECHNNYVKSIYALTPYHNRLQNFISISQEYRWAEIPQTSQIFDKQVYYNDYIYVSDEYENFDEYTKMSVKSVNLSIREMFTGRLSENDFDYIEYGNSKIGQFLIKTDGTENYFVLGQIMSYGISDGLVFSFGFKHNQIGGNQIKRLMVSGYIQPFNSAVKYTRNDGRISKLWFGLFSDTNKLVSGSSLESIEEYYDNYPKVYISDIYTVNFFEKLYVYSGNYLENANNYDGLILDKDSSQNIKVNYQISFISNKYNQFIFGKSLFQNNFMVSKIKKNIPNVNDEIMWNLDDDVDINGHFDFITVYPNFPIATAYGQTLKMITGNWSVVTSGYSGNLTSKLLDTNIDNVTLTLMEETPINTICCITPYKLVQTNIDFYNASQYKREVVGDFDSTVSWKDVMLAYRTTYLQEFNDDRMTQLYNSNACIRTDNGLGYTYWKFEFVNLVEGYREPVYYRLWSSSFDYYSTSSSVKYYGQDKYIYIYNNGTKYDIFSDLLIKKGYSAKIKISLGINVSLIKHEDGKSGYYIARFSGDILNYLNNNPSSTWAIGDSSENLYMACNENKKEIYFLPKHFRKGIKEIGKL